MLRLALHSREPCQTANSMVTDATSCTLVWRGQPWRPKSILPWLDLTLPICKRMQPTGTSVWSPAKPGRFSTVCRFRNPDPDAHIRSRANRVSDAPAGLNPCAQPLWLLVLNVSSAGHRRGAETLTGVVVAGHATAQFGRRTPHYPLDSDCKMYQYSFVLIKHFNRPNEPGRRGKHDRRS